MTRFKAIVAIAMVASCIRCPAEGDLLKSIHDPPAKQPEQAPVLRPLLNDASGKPIVSQDGWEKRRKTIKEDWQRLLGPFPERKCDLKLTVLKSESLTGFTRQYVTYQIEDGVTADGYLLVPDAAGKRLPGMVVFHSTVKQEAKLVAGVDVSVPEKEQGVQLVERGYVVLCPRNFIYNEGADFAGNVKRVKQRHPDWTGMGKMVYDGIRAVDVLASLPSVDPTRIGVIGHSLGGKEAFYVAAFDERVKAAVSSEGGIGLKFSNWDAEWYLGPGINNAAFKRENHEVLSLVAPRAFLLLAGNSADTDKSWTFIEAVMPVYRLLGADADIGWFNHRLGHRYPPEAQAVAEAFLDQHLKRRD